MSSPDPREITLVRCLKCMKILSCSHYDTLALLDHIRTDHPEIDVIDTDGKPKQKQKRSPSPSPKHKKAHSPSRKSKKSQAVVRPNEIREYQNTHENCLSQYKDHSAHNEYECQDYDHSARRQFVKDDDDLSQPSKIPELCKFYRQTKKSIKNLFLFYIKAQKYREIKHREVCSNGNNTKVGHTRCLEAYTPSAIVSMELLRSPIRRSKYRTSIENWQPGTGKIYCPKCGMSKKPLMKSPSKHFTNNACSSCCLLTCWPLFFIPFIIPGRNKEYLYCGNCKTFLGFYNPTTNCVKPNQLYVPTAEDSNCMENYKHDYENVDENLDLCGDCQTVFETNQCDVNAFCSNHLPTITVNGKELPPETVARIQKYRSYGSMLGIEWNCTANQENHVIKDNTTKEPAPTKKDKKTKKKKKCCWQK